MSTIILSAEDDDAAYRLLEIAFRELDINCRLYRVSDGADALKFLRRTYPFEAAPRPNLILLNLNMPRMSGHELLARIQQYDTLKTIPAVVFSSSKLDADRAACLALGAKHFITKPTDYLDLLSAVKTACGFASVSSV